jgi:hypothetical protein
VLEASAEEEKTTDEVESEEEEVEGDQGEQQEQEDGVQAVVLKHVQVPRAHLHPKK